MASWLLGMDIGTSSVKALLAEAASGARIGGTVVVDYASEPASPKAGWSEHDPDQWWDGVVRAVGAVCEAAGASPGDIVGVGLSGQMHGSVFLDENGAVIRPALLWNDQRTAAQCDAIRNAAGGLDGLLGLVRNDALTGFTLPKILWLRDHEPDNFAKLRTVMLPKDYIRYKLSGVIASEVSDASGMLLVDVTSRKWASGLMEKLDLDPAMLPPLFESEDAPSRVHAEGSRATGIPQDTPISGGAGDQPAGAVGNGIVEPGIVSCTMGTSGVVFAHADEPVPNPGGTLQSFCHAVRGKWCVFGCMLSAGGSLQWLRNTLGGAQVEAARAQSRDPYALLIELAETAPPVSEGLFFLPYLTGERCPHPDPLARGGWVGLTARHGFSHMVRSVIEGITFGMKDQVALMRSAGVPVTQIRASGGGARSEWWCQLMADIFDAEIVLTNSTEGGAFGAALLAGSAAGVFDSVQQACRDSIAIQRRWTPQPAMVDTYAKAHEVYQQLYVDLKATFPKMAALD